MEKEIAFRIEAVQGELDTMEATLTQSRQRIAQTRQVISNINARLATAQEVVEKAKLVANRK